MEKAINIIPDDYKGNPQEALGYCWTDIKNKIAGIDVVVKCTKDGIDYKKAAQKAMEENGIKTAYINCMWCGGYSGTMDIDNPTAQTEKTIVPVTMEEEAAQTKIIESVADRNIKHVGWCDKCRSYCYGDCEAN